MAGQAGTTVDIGMPADVAQNGQTGRISRSIGFPPTGRFLSDPQGAAALTWVAAPVLVLTALLTVAYVAPAWYLRWIQPEGYGVQELAHFILPAATAVVALITLRDRWVRGQPMVLAWLAMLALGTIYIAGEEHSWGQHLFEWRTPAYWSQLNAQGETNLHNVSDIYGKLPRSILLVGIVLLGFLYPLIAHLRPALHQRNPLAIFMPPLALWPAAACLVIVEIAALFDAAAAVSRPAIRLSEISETFIYLFLLLGVLILRRRILEMRS